MYELQKNTILINGKKTPESSRALEARVAALEAKKDNSSDESLFPDEKSKANNKNNSALERKKWNQTEPHRYLMIRALKWDSQPSVLRDGYV